MIPRALQGSRLTNNVIDKVDITTNDNGKTKQYIGMMTNSFKERYRNVFSRLQVFKQYDNVKTLQSLYYLEEKFIIMTAYKETLLNKTVIKINVAYQALAA